MSAVVLLTLAVGLLPLDDAPGDRIPLSNGWALRSSAGLSVGGVTISRPGLSTAGWHRIRVPNTVVVR